ncbi:uncharacterized protein EV154DRAFT_504599 [Mucor mucedo]|uniref:uncharacterized protein n=1 Tax=Mucor mucedo TaxID=29922 RepID=UPI00222108A9|nr:uncharacterized protein EV154DRAFT_504599 [Mucor mucedo]KAI7892484.1 hypothetical protein EV154DRAFT_504599 [Mucor mucedo]
MSKLNGFEVTVQKCIEDLQSMFKDYNNSIGSNVVTALSPPQYDTSDDSTTSSPCEEFHPRRDFLYSGDHGTQADSTKQITQPVYAAAVTNSRDPRLVAQRRSIPGTSRPTVGPVKSDRSLNSNVHVSNRPVARATDFSLPDIKFDGSVHFDKQQSISVPNSQILSEGLLVDKFIEDFETQLKLSRLDLDHNWFDLLETRFKQVRDSRLNLYLWFKRRLHEGLSWQNAKYLIRYNFGFHSSNSLALLKKQFLSLKQYPQEHFNDFYLRFSPYAFSCHIANIFSEKEDSIVYVFLSVIINSSILDHLFKALRNLQNQKYENRSLSRPENHSVNTCIKSLSMVPSSWLEFDQLIIKPNMTYLILLDTKPSLKSNKNKHVADETQLAAQRTRTKVKISKISTIPTKSRPELKKSIKAALVNNYGNSSSVNKNRVLFSDKKDFF